MASANKPGSQSVQASATPTAFVHGGLIESTPVLPATSGSLPMLCRCLVTGFLFTLPSTVTASWLVPLSGHAVGYGRYQARMHLPHA